MCIIASFHPVADELERVINVITGVRKMIGLSLNVKKTQFLPLSERYTFDHEGIIPFSQQIKILGVL